MALSDADVQRIAHLARLTLTPDEGHQLAGQLSTILDFIDQINAVNTDHVEGIAHALDLSQRRRDDVVTETDEREKLQKIAPAVEAGLYLVPKVIESA